MPIHEGIDEQGHFYQWGGHGKKYYYKLGDVDSKNEAYNKALHQAQAAYAHGYHH